MRSLLIFVITFVVIGGGFFVYYALQTESAPGDATAGAGATAGAPTTLPADAPPPPEMAQGATVAGPGKDVWIKSFDERMRVTFQFRASRYDPRPQGPVDVTDPQAEIFTGSGDDRQVIRIEGKTGRVVMASSPAQRGIRPGAGGDAAAAPRRGELRDVTITLLDERDMSRPLMVCKLNNVTFDNDTYRIATERYTDASGREVPADQVVVEVRGDDFDFDGRGLTLRWNEADKLLQLLEIAHGERLVIKSPEMLERMDQSAARADARRDDAPDDAPGEQAVLASYQQEPQAEPKAEPTTGPTRKPSAPPPVYRATFRDAVRITRGGEMLASAEQMLVDFLGDDEPGASTRRAPDRKQSAASKRPRDGATPATQPAAPVVVNWTGKLRVTALEGNAPRPAPGSMNIAMSDETQPVVLRHQGMDLRCASFDYRSGDDSLSVTSSTVVPQIELKLSDGSTVRTPSIVYSGTDSRAVLRGPSRAEWRMPADGDKPAESMTAEWEKACVLILSKPQGGDGPGEMSIERAQLEGAVRVNHPQLSLRADALDLGVKPTAGGEPALDEIKASGGVECRLTDSAGNRQDIRCDQLAAATAPGADGKPAPRTITADGNVVATRDEAEMRAGHLTITLAPARRGADGAPAQGGGGVIGGDGEYEVESLVAQKDVKLALRNERGGGGTADQLVVQLTPQGTVAELFGQPATFGDGANTLSGPHIKYEQASQHVRVQGAGTLAFSARETPEQPAREVNVAWSSGLTYKGSENSAEVAGDSSMTSTAPDGARQVAAADRILVTLADAPPPPSTAPMQAAARKDAAAEQFDLGGEKVLRGLTLAGNAQVWSVLQGKSEDEIRRIHLLAPEVRYDVEAGRAEVPSAGRMLVQDTMPAPQQAPARARSGNELLGDFRGATAFQWADDLVLDQRAGRMTMSGSVLIVHEDPAKPDQQFRMEAAQVTADLRDDESDRARPAQHPRPAQADALFGPSELRLKALAASGDIRLRSPQIQLDAEQLTYDAVGELLTARGDDRTPVELYNELGVSRGSFQEVVWDAKTEQFKMRQVQAQVRR